MIDKPRYSGRELEAMSFAYRYHLWILKEFMPFVGKDLVEVGAGTGDFSQLLVDTHPDSLVAIEPSSNLFPALAERMKDVRNTAVFNAYFGDVSSGLPCAPDTVFYINVLEHIEDDGLELDYIFDSLRSGGHVCVFVPALQWLYSNVDASVGHNRRYHKQPLIDLVRKSGFEIIKCRYFDIVGILPWWLLFRVLRMELKTNQVSIYDKVVVPVMQKIEGAIQPPVGKNLLLVGRKK